MPFAQNFFDSIVSVDSYHYFGCKKNIFKEKILPFVKMNGYVMIAIPGIKEEPQGEMREIFTSWAEGDDSELFQTIDWWETLIKEGCGESCEEKAIISNQKKECSMNLDRGIWRLQIYNTR